MSTRVRVRFAPSPTGGLHLGGVRTVLYNYLFARKHKGDFILRIEDTDQSRYVAGAEDYIFRCLDWCGLNPDESPVHGGSYGPYRQSERKALYRQYAEQLVEAGHAYYAFDTPEELEQMRLNYKTDQQPAPQYDHSLRLKMRNSLTLSPDETRKLLDEGTRHVIRIKMPVGETVSFRDMIRGEVSFETSLVDDKVLLKADGMPTYHLAVVVDDYLMKITHAFRGEEWLPSAPVHILLWQYLFGREAMPEWAHLPLILGPSGKLSKRDGAKYGFPVFAMNWADPKTGENIEGFREKGFLPEAFVNFLALLGWNDGTDKELFTLEELITAFEIDRVHSGGARFDYEKAKWFNHEWIKSTPAAQLRDTVQSLLQDQGIAVKDGRYLEKVIDMVKERCTLLTDFAIQSGFFFQAPREIDLAPVQGKWSAAKTAFFKAYAESFDTFPDGQADSLEQRFKDLATAHQIKPGELQLPFRLMLVGGKYGPPVFEIAACIGAAETRERINRVLAML